jgi:cysteinyl-tRNA synthetase
LSTPLFAVREKITLLFFNQMTRKKELFEPTIPGNAAIYSCGPTAHARIQLGEMRRFVFADQLCRYLQFRGYAVNHVVDINDLDDKTIDGSEKAGMDLAEFTEANIRHFFDDLNTLGIQPAENYPRASKYVDEMVSLAEKLVHKGVAYEKLRSLYFDISRLPSYGELSGINIDKIRIGATVDLDEYEKENPRDFTLFKRSKLSELKRGIFTKTDWGTVRPSWHIKSAAISMKLLGQFYDIHTSSRELVFPHHENENAIAVAVSGNSLAKYWVHCERVLVDGKKPDDQSTALSISDLQNMGYTGRVIRYWLLSNHYRKPLSFSRARLDDAQRALERLDHCLLKLQNLNRGEAYPELDQLLYDLKHGFTNAMDDDLNIPAAMASLFKMVKRINGLLHSRQLGQQAAKKILDGFRSIDRVLNIMNFAGVTADPDIARLIKDREDARAQKNWELADKIRDQLLSKGVIVQDRKV